MNFGSGTDYTYEYKYTSNYGDFSAKGKNLGGIRFISEGKLAPSENKKVELHEGNFEKSNLC